MDCQVNKIVDRKIKGYIRGQVAKYKRYAISVKGKDSIDSLNDKTRFHYENCERFINTFDDDLTYYQKSLYLDFTNESLEDVDKTVFGCYVDGVCVGYKWF